MEAGPGQAWLTVISEEAWFLMKWGHFLALERHVLWLIFPSRHFIFSWELPLPQSHA